MWSCIYAPLPAVRRHGGHRVLASGSNGTVVAIKVCDYKNALPLAQDELCLRRAKLEAETHKTICEGVHPSPPVIRLLHFEANDDRFPCMAIMEMAECDLLTELQRRCTAREANTFQTIGLMSDDDARNFFRQMLNSCRYLKDKGFVHGDLKPENALLTQRDPAILKLADFGASKRLNEGVNQGTGTKGFMSPEVHLWRQRNEYRKDAIAKANEHGERAQAAAARGDQALYEAECRAQSEAFQAAADFATLNTHYDEEKADVWSLGVMLAMRSSAHRSSRSIDRSYRWQLRARSLSYRILQDEQNAGRNGMLALVRIGREVGYGDWQYATEQKCAPLSGGLAEFLDALLHHDPARRLSLDAASAPWMVRRWRRWWRRWWWGRRRRRRRWWWRRRR